MSESGTTFPPSFPRQLHQPCPVFSHFHLPSERTMDLVLEMCNTRSIHWCGISGHQLGKLSPAASLSLPLTLLSSVQGLQVRAQPFFSFSFFYLPPPPKPPTPPSPVPSRPRTGAHTFRPLISEHLWTEAHRHLPEEDVRVRRRGAGVRDLPVHEQRELRLPFFFPPPIFILAELRLRLMKWTKRWN